MSAGRLCTLTHPIPKKDKFKVPPPGIEATGRVSSHRRKQHRCWFRAKSSTHKQKMCRSGRRSGHLQSTRALPQHPHRQQHRKRRASHKPASVHSGEWDGVKCGCCCRPVRPRQSTPSPAAYDALLVGCSLHAERCAEHPRRTEPSRATRTDSQNFSDLKWCEIVRSITC